MAKRTHLWKAQCTYPRNKYFLTYRIVLISKLQTALIFSIVISVPFNEYSATVVFASYVVLLHADKVNPKNNNVNGGTSFKSSDCINAFNVMKAFNKCIWYICKVLLFFRFVNNYGPWNGFCQCICICTSSMCVYHYQPNSVLSQQGGFLLHCYYSVPQDYV